jgi:hypothetical protein
LGLTTLTVAIGLAGCGGGSSSTTPPSTLTPKGTYTLVIVATQGATTHNQSITLVVQ